MLQLLNVYLWTRKEQIFLLRVSLNRNEVFNLRWDQKTTFKFQTRTVLLTLLTKRDLKCNDFLWRNGRTQLNCFFEANKYTSFLTYKLSRYFLMQKSLKTFFKFSISWWNISNLEHILKALYDNEEIKAYLYELCTKLLKLVNTPLNVGLR